MKVNIGIGNPVRPFPTTPSDLNSFDDLIRGVQMSVREMLEQLVPDSGPTYNFGDGPWTCHERPQDYRKRVIDALADGAEIKYRRRYQNGTFSDSFNSDIFSDNDPHSTITLKPQPIRRGVTKAEIVAEIKSWHNVVLDKLAARIEAEGIIE